MKPNSQKDEIEHLAREIARGLGEEEYLPIYRRLVQKHDHQLVWRAYREARAVPEEEIRKSRGAIFNYLLKKYVKEAEENSGDRPGDA